MSFDVDNARRNMITQQVRAWGVLDDQVLELLEKIPREEFVPQKYRELAFADMPTPIGAQQSMLPPKEEGKILQALEIEPSDDVLEIGTGSGYFTALLASQAKHVTTVDICEKMQALARANLEKQAIHNVTLELGDGCNGWPMCSPYDVIVVTGSMPTLNHELLNQLKEGGRLFAIVGLAPAMQAVMIKKVSPNELRQDILYETVAPALKNADAEQIFKF